MQRHKNKNKIRYLCGTDTSVSVALNALGRTKFLSGVYFYCKRSEWKQNKQFAFMKQIVTNGGEWVQNKTRKQSQTNLANRLLHKP